MDIISCPRWYLGYPFDAKHQILIKIQEYYKPKFWHLDLTEEITRTKKVPIEQQLFQRRHYQMAKEFQPLYCPVLVTKDKTTQVYLEDDIIKIYVPFISHFPINPGLMDHYKSSKAAIFAE